jgi:hypothetical protein
MSITLVSRLGNIEALRGNNKAILNRQGEDGYGEKFPSPLEF